MVEAGEGVAFVTGAGRGIGRACTDRLLADGWTVFAGVRDVARARAEYGARPGLEIVACDVTDTASVAAAVAAAQQAGPIRALVLNAGHAMFSTIEESDQDLAREMFEVNVFGAGNVLTAALPGMRDGGGVVVMISSIAARGASPMLGWYSASKAALTSIGESLSSEVAPFGIRVAMLEPGMVATEFSQATRVSGAATSGEGPYAPLFGGMIGAFGRWRERYSSTTEDVAAAVSAALTDPETPLRAPLGDDARELMDIVANAPERDARRTTVRDFLGVDWGA
jgi:NAD(P)-dependent dehydrogenase (short-subunit alcohol dehydrogenase family)